MIRPVTYSIREGFSLQLFKSADEIPTAHWNKLVDGLSLFLSIDYLKALDISWTESHQFVYALLYKNDLPFAALYFQAIDLSAVKIGSIIHVEPYGKFLKLVSDKITDSLIRRSEGGAKWFLVNGNMCASGEYGIACSAENRSALANIYIEVLNTITEYLKVSGEVSVFLSKDFPFNNDFLSAQFKEEKFIRFVMDPVMVVAINPGWNDFEDYLMALSSKYRLRASTVIEKVAALELRELYAHDILKFSTKLDALYQAVIGKSPVRVVHPDIQYIYNIKVELQDKFNVKCWFDKDEPVAFYTSLQNDKELDAHHIGIDYHLNKSHALYQNILYSLMKDAIQCKSPQLNFGRTAMEMKSTVGAVPEDYVAYIKLNNKVLNHLLRPFLPSQPPDKWVQRDPFRKT